MAHKRLSSTRKVKQGCSCKDGMDVGRRRGRRVLFHLQKVGQREVRNSPQPSQALLKVEQERTRMGVHKGQEEHARDLQVVPRKGQR